MSMSVILGYDPGGNHSHGVAAASVAGDRIVGITTATCETAADALSWLQSHERIVGVGVDTLAAWSLGASGWRAADRWLKRQYPNCQASVVSPNGLYGSMGINGMAVLCALRSANSTLIVCETHPKVLYHALCGEKYSYASHRRIMNDRLVNWAKCSINPKNDHEWDAALSAYAAAQGFLGHWTMDLYEKSIDQGESLVWPCGESKYWWPDT